MTTKNLLGLTLVALMAVGCGSSSTPAETKTEPAASTAGEAGTTAKPGAEKLIVGVVFDSGGLGDGSFNDSAWAGLQRANKEIGIPEARKVSSKDASVYETNLQQLANGGANLVIAVGFGMQESLKKVAPKFPNVKFAIVDGEVDAPNVRSLKFREEQGSFLAGYLAAMTSKTGKIGFVGGMEIPLIKKFEYGYYAGAKSAKPTIEILPAKYTGDWNNSDKGKASAAALYGGGADIVYHAAGRAGLGVFQAAKEAKKYAIGVDSNQDALAEGLVLTSMVKRVDNAVYSTIEDILADKFTPGVKEYDVASGGVGLTDFAFTKDIIGESTIAKLKEIEKQLVDGTIVAPLDQAQYDAFIAKMAK